MWRAFFCALGGMLLILGVEFLLIDSATWAESAADVQPAAGSGFFSQSAMPSVSREFRPAEWMPWSALLSGGVVLLYALTLRRQHAV
jgi:hypothetical protein